VENKAAIEARLRNLSPEQRNALMQQISRRRQQQEIPLAAGSSYPLSQAQYRLWMLSQLGDEASAAYNIAAAFVFDKVLDPERLQRAWRRLLARHEVLGSAFSQENNQLQQKPREPGDWTMQTRKLAADRDLESQLLHLADTEAAKPFDLQHDWLLRVIYCQPEKGVDSATLPAHESGIVVVIHHIVCDGLSITGMIRELAHYYQETTGLADLPQPTRAQAEPVRQYRDFIAYESGMDNSKALAYWQSVFATPPQTLDGLLDRPRHVVQDFNGDSVALTLPRADTAAFEALCHAHNATLYMGLVALVQLLLARFAQVHEVTLGTPVAGRPGSQFDEVVGPFVNTIALRQSIDLKQNFPELLLQVRRRVLDGFQHQGLAFDALVTNLGFAKDPSRSPLYDAMIGFSSADDLTLSFDNSTGRSLRIPTRFSKVDLTFHFEKQTDGTLQLELEYASAVLSEASVRCLSETWRLLASTLPQQQSLELSALPLQSDKERRRLVEGVNATARPYPQQSSLIDKFRDVVRDHPEKIAVHAGEIKLSYRALDNLSERLSQQLLKHSAHQPGCRIALMLEKDERALVVMLAILKSDAVYVPLAANTPLERVTQVATTGEVSLLFAEKDRLRELQGLDVALIDTNEQLSIDASATTSIPESVTVEVSQPREDAVLLPAYLMFTSGSTGKPKGTLIGQRSVLRLVCNTDYHQVQVNERVLLTGSLAFDAATFEIWGPLLNAGCVCIPTGTTLLEVHEFSVLVNHYQVDTAFLTTGLFNQLVDNSPAAFARLQTVLTGGEKVSVGHIRKLMQMHPELNLLHVYGPTENTTFSSWHRINEDDLNQATIPIGRPIANSRLYLLDQNLQPVPVGVPGEIYCGGDGVALGYIDQGNGDAVSQSDAFLADPFLPAGEGRLYRTRDLAKWNHKRELVFLGRNDRQIKIRGFRVELSEVEFHLRTLPDVTDAFVQARGDAGSSELVAWLVVSADTHLSVAGVRDALKDSVPNYMLPAKVVRVARLPLNASGKVDVNALPMPENADVDDATTVEAGKEQLHGQAELDMAKMYASVLGLSSNAIGRDVNFFSLGGDSIRAIQLVSLARSEGYHFTLKDIFASETLAGLAASAARTATAEIEPVLPVAPLSPTLHWWLEQCGNAADHFNLSSVFRVSTPIDMKALRATLDALLELHPALRLTLDPASQQQHLSADGRYVLLEAAGGQSRLHCWQQLQKSISLKEGVLLAVGVATEAGESYLAVVVHHIAADEVSGRLFTENLQRVYHTHLAGTAMAQRDSASTGGVQQPMQEALAVTNWAEQLKATVARGAMQQDLGYWQETVRRGREVLAQQQHLFAEPRQTRGHSVQMLPREESQSVMQLASTLLRMKPQEFVLAAFVQAWRSVLDNADCLLSLEGHGREQLEGLGNCSSTVGWFTSLYPFVFTGSPEPGFNLYREIKDSLRALPARGFSYLPLRYYSGQQTQQSLTLSPQLSFNYLGESIAAEEAWLQPAAEQAGDDHGATVTEPFKLDALARISNGQFELTLRGQTPLPALSLDALAGAWMNELVTLNQRLRSVTSGATADYHLLSRSDCLVAFKSLAELDATMSELSLPSMGVDEILPLTGMQAGMWLHCATHPTAYQDQVCLRLQQSIDEIQFALALQALVAETQALRTGFVQTRRGDLLQIVLKQRENNYQFVDAEAWHEPIEAGLEQLRTRLRGARRDLLRDALFSLTLVRINAGCFELIIDFHHIAIDGWTSALLLQRLEALYFGDADRGDSNAARGMRAWFEWQEQQPGDQARDYWQGFLGDYQRRSEVPVHLPRVPASDPQPMFVENRIGAALHTTLLNWCAQQGVTLNAVVQALWGVFLGRLTGSDDIVFGATVSGRDRDLEGVENIAGMLINTLPVRVCPGQSDCFDDLVRETAQQFADSMMHGHLSLAELQTLTPARTGLVTHALVFENYPDNDAAAARWQWQPQEIFDPMHFEFGLIVAPLADDLSFRIVADGSLYLRDRLEQMGTDLCTLLSQLLDNKHSYAALTGPKVNGWTVSANFTADSLVGLLEYHEHIGGDSRSVTLLPYDQSVQDLINPGSRLRSMPAKNHIVLWRPPVDSEGCVDESRAHAQLAELASAVAAYVHDFPDSYLIFVPCPWPDNDWALYREFASFVKGALSTLRNAEVLKLENFAETYGLQQPCHPPELIFGDIPYTEEFFAALANRLVRTCDLRNRPPVKVYVVDADDTLWGGIVGEDGPLGVRLESVHVDLQKKLIQARAAGALICLATKNNEDDVRAVFEQRDMPLRWNHLTRVRAGWGLKSESIQALSEDLSLGLDSFVFIDDSPLECEQVQSACPGVLVIQLPEAAEREPFLNHHWLLDARAATREDAVRSQMYEEELQRVDVRKSAGSYAEFIASLSIHIDISQPEPADMPRLAQLSQRTNQFNTTGVRYSETQLHALLQEPDTDIRCVRVTDKYGDYGLAGSILIRREPGLWVVSAFMLSCRVLGRGVEHAILRQLAQEAEANGADRLQVDFAKLAKNAPALQFLTGVVSASGDQAQALSPEASKRQFVLPVADSGKWQLTAGIANSEAGAGGHAVRPQPGELTADHASFQVSVRASAYYRYLASTLSSGSAIMQELQRNQTIHKTGSAGGEAGLRTPPTTPTEVLLAGFFVELLGPADVCREDSFHDLGGHSLKAMMLLSRIAASVGLMLDFQDLYELPTLASLASRIDENTSNAAPANPASTSLRALPAADSYPLSTGQSRLWLVDRIRGDGPSPFHMHATLTVSGRLDRQVLDKALTSLFYRHEALRTCFRENARGDVRQVVVSVNELNTRAHWFDEVIADAELSEKAQHQSALNFDLATAPLIRVAVGELVSGCHVVLITMHHIISDGWSIGIFSRELTRLYEHFSQASVSDTESTPPIADAVQFRDFAVWQREWLLSEAGERATRFWRQHFAHPVTALQLPAAAPRPALKQSMGNSVSIDIDATLWTGFKRSLSGLGGSDFTGLFAALQLVLARLSGQQDFCIGTAVAGRRHPQLESVIGFFVNILPLRATLNFDASVSDFLQSVAAEVNDCLSHQDVPFDTIVAGLDLPRDPGRSPLFDVLLVMQNTEIDELRFCEHIANVYPVASTTSQYDLGINAFPGADGTLKLLAEYDSVIYSAANIELILRCLRQTMTALSDARTEALADLPWLHHSDISRVLGFEGEPGSQGNAGIEAKRVGAPAVSLPAIFRRSVADANGRIRDGKEDWSFCDLERQMQRLAGSLRQYLAVLPPNRKQAHVGVIGKRSVHSIAAMLGTMAAGAVYIPLDLGNPVDRLRLIVQEAAVDLLLSTDDDGNALACELLSETAQDGIGHLTYNDMIIGSETANDLADAAEFRPVAGDIAYMIFTSGSTGKPKGVEVSHAAFAAMITQQIPAFGITSADVCGQFAALSFDASLSEIFLALGTGASLVITPDSTRADMDAFMAWLRDNAVSVMTLPPVFLRALNQQPLHGLRVLITAGEAAIGADLRHYATSMRVLNAYGPTETAVCASVYEVNISDDWPFGVPIGKPLPGSLLTVRDNAGARVPVGCVGELYIGGSTLGEGYFRAPELSKQKFCTLPGDPRQQRWYRSGDLVRWREDGLLEFLGRVDAQIKVRGYRIEPAEIEYAARGIEGVGDAIALVHPQLGLILVCRSVSESVTSDAELRSEILAVLGRQLPRYMVPGEVLLLDGFPLSSAGKVDRTKLIALASARSTSDASRYIAPDTNAEQILAQAWKRGLKLDRVGKYDEFFALGGDSIKALEVINALRESGYSCELQAFFAHPVLAEMADCLTPWQADAQHQRALVGDVGLLPVQRWFLHSRNRDAAEHFHIVVALDTPADLNDDWLETAVSTLMRNHDSLRVSFSQDNDGWRQTIHETLNMDDVLLHFQRTALMETPAEREAIEALACRPFALDMAPLCRFVLVRGPGGESEYLVLALHHLIADWVSLRILLTDLNSLALTLTEGKGNHSLAISPPAPPHLLRDLAAQRAAEQVSETSAGLTDATHPEYLKAAATMTSLALNCGVHRSLETQHLQIPAAELARLRDSLRARSTESGIEFRLQDFLLAVTLGELRELLPIVEVPLLVEGHGRDGQLDLGRQVAWLTRARLVNVDTGLFVGPAALKQANRVLHVNVSAQPDVFACVAADASPCRALPALVSFNYLGEFANSPDADAPFRLTDRVFEKAMSPASPVDVPLHIECYIVDNVLEIQVAWSPEVFASEPMQACWDRVQRHLAGF
jgi:amino acid adenylation domain-containing protein/FkbH-like protein/non-ribosomal peptide synthase protein (TIGR01720 family)